MANSLQHIENIIKIIEDDILATNSTVVKENICHQEFSEIAAAIQYPLTAGGKRIRPLLTLLCAGTFGGEKAIQNARNAALALEMIHTYSLVHDDLPCMDNDDLRRGKPTTHKIYGEAKGLLVGDALLTEAFFRLAQTECKVSEYLQSLVQELSYCSGIQGMIAGQWLDISFTGKQDLSWEQIELIHKNKTGRLLGCAFVLGYICGLNVLEKVDNQENLKINKDKLRQAGEFVGIAFQIIDDILDITASSQSLGKTAGKDQEQCKATSVAILGLEKAQILATEFTSRAYTLLEGVFEKLPTNSENEIYKNLLFQQLEQLLVRKY
ncbi:polyprenyl synthetase family protein [Pigmentibacter sp. JX0631]|uniref:polyprenyl synthetase family protein n=1 Tax=Pigmentibacter sp. JX0631 TaxID=2976982 RepID=UPI00246830C3|nr:polyprenyl synthetase family protein [Pigmentibacter sp. JX0631]WGL60306.1 polyprenyl synthetase family protein [Pigmentibacter sp. JX0631]